MDGAAGNYTVELFGAVVTNGCFDATLNPSQFWSFNANFFLNFIASGSIWDGATAFYNIAPNSYVIRSNWIDIDGISREVVGEGEVGEIWRGSSIGPTFDGRFGIDVSAPGDRIVTSYAPQSYWAIFRSNLIQDGNGLYGMASAVSAAAPIVTGIIALMLEANPELDAPTVKQILQQSTRSDQFTGQVPNTVWGYGKVDAYAALNGTVPIELVSFTGKVVSGGVLLEWETASETNNFGFNLERGQDEEHLEKIGFVAGSGTTVIPQSYSFLDSTATAGTYYYRLKQIDTDGSFEYSPIVSVMVVDTGAHDDRADIPKNFTLEQNYPNPFNPSTTINYTLGGTGQTTLKVYNLLGEEIRVLVDEVQVPGEYSITWDGIENTGRSVASGVYILHLKSGALNETRKVTLFK